jgi:hypothetical protein
MVNRKIAAMLATLVVLLALPIIHAQPEASFLYTFNLGVSGQGALTWLGMYQNAIYTSGSTSSSVTITVPQGTVLTFTATPQYDNTFAYWNIDQSSQGSTNPYVLYTLNMPTYQTVFADFVPPVQYYVANPPLQSDTINVGVLAGSGKVYWSSSYNGVDYTSGWTDTSTTITVPHGATVSFTATPASGNHFENWVIDSFNQGSNNPYIIYGTGASSYGTVLADFD